MAHGQRNKNFDCQGSATSQLARRCADSLKKGIRGLFKWGGSVKALIYDGRRQKLSATPDLSGTVLPLCLIPNSALKSAPPFKSVMPKA
ncbi:hypothetical protein, partial [Pseudomonas helleri]|uniref:hypothetical protein n=1 Tax=Pseudomonas helleri TaxID=1608996 RepID=UPI003FD2102E